MAECNNEIDGLPLLQLRRFLYLGTGDISWQAKQSPIISRNAGIVDTLLKEGRGSEIIQNVVKFHREGCSVHQDALVYALAVCSLSPNNIFKRDVFTAVKEVCVSASQMLTFIHYHKQLSSPSTGFGRFTRHFLSSWYNNKDVKNLAMETTRVVSRRRWTHKDVLLLSHVKAAKPEIEAVIKYLMGLKEPDADYSAIPEAQDVLAYLKAVDELKHTTDSHTAARLIEVHNLCFEHVPSTLLKSREIWTCLIRRLKTSELLLQLPRLHKLGLLKLNSPHLKSLLERLRDENALGDGDLGPLETFLAIRKWESANRVVPGRTVIRQSIPQLEEALMNLHMESFKAISSTHKRYLIAVDVCSTMLSTHTAGCNSLSPADVSMVVLMALARSEVSNVTVLAYSTNELVPIDINNKMSLSDIAQRMKDVPMGPVDLGAPVKWALEHKKAFDIVLVFTDSQTKTGGTHPAGALKEYKQALNLPESRFIAFALNSTETSLPPSDDTDILLVAGFHVKLLQIIQDFARKVF